MHRVYVCVCVLAAWSCPTPWTTPHWAPLSTEFSGQEYWRAQPFLSSGSSQLRDQTWVLCIEGRFFTALAIQGSPQTNKKPTIIYT